MLKHVALALFLGGQFVVAQYTIEEHEIGRVNKARCKDAQGFTCAVLFEFDPPVPSDSTASISGPEYDLVRGITLILDGTLYRAVYDPPLKRENGFSVVRMECNPGILARIEGDHLLVSSAGGMEAKAKVGLGEKIHNRPTLP